MLNARNTYRGTGTQICTPLMPLQQTGKHFIFCFPSIFNGPKGSAKRKKIISDQAEGIMVVPNWVSQPWYSVLRAMLIDEPIIFLN